MAVRVLSFHRSYACQDSGVCCTSGWPIPVEQDRLIQIQKTLESGVLRAASGSSRTALVAHPDAPAESPAVLGLAGHECVFFDRGEQRHCRIQHTIGHAALPLACRQFPRISVQTPAGISVTLSHYCPTAAELLRLDETVSILTDTSAFPGDGEYVGLDVRESLPPLLCPDVLMDWESWLVWEERSVRLLCDVADTAEDGVSRLHAAVEDLRRWRPGSDSLSIAITRAFDRASSAFKPYRVDGPSRTAEVLAAIPKSAQRLAHRYAERARGPGRESADAEKRFLAAHAFANWTAYTGNGLRAWFRSLEAAYALLGAGYGLAGTDLLLRHLADSAALTRIWNRADN